MNLKRIVAILLVIVMSFSVASCSKKVKEEETTTDAAIYNDISEETDVSEKEKTTAGVSEEKTTKKPYLEEFTTKKYKYDSPENGKTDKMLKKAIKAIMDFKYKGYHEDFIDFDIYSKPEKELELIYNTDYKHTCDPELYPINYAWYNNGVVDEDLLYKRIVQNNRNEGILMTADCKRIAKMLAQVAQNNIDYLKENQPSFNFNIPLYHLDTVTVNTSTEDWYYSLYVFDFNRILVNFTDIHSEDFFRSTVSHELFHLFSRGEVGMKKIFLAGSSIDSLDTHENPLEQNFINEYFVETASYSAFGEVPRVHSYERERCIIELISRSTDTDFDDFESVAFGTDKSMIYYAFEEEFRNPNFVYSTLYAYDLSCQYNMGVVDIYDYDYYVFKDDHEIYATFNVMKNLYVRLLKEIYYGETTYSEACEEISVIMDMFPEYFAYEISVDKVIDDLDVIFHEYAEKL